MKSLFLSGGLNMYFLKFLRYNLRAFFFPPKDLDFILTLNGMK